MDVHVIKSNAKPRFENGYFREFNIESYGRDNLYPQYLQYLINASPTACGCVERYAEFIEGNGLRDITASNYIVNRCGETLDELHKLISADYAKFGGFCLHINYNADGYICEINFVPFENARLCEPDDKGYISQICLHPDWTGKSSRSGKTLQVNKSACTYLNIFNPLRPVVLSQIANCGGVEYYRGQILYYGNCGANRYPISRADRVATEMSTDEGLANVKYRNVRNNFLPSGMVVTKKGQEAPDEEEIGYGDGFSDVLQEFQGDTNCGKLIEVIVESDEEKPEFVPINTANYDKEFSITEATTTERIYSAYGQENFYCIRIGKTGFSGDIVRDAFAYYNSVVAREQRSIQRVLERVFNNWFEHVANDFSIEPLIYKSAE